jgi:hypothetical protein
MLGGERLYIANKKARKHIRMLHNVSAFLNCNERDEGISRKTRVRCSCYMCGHRREMEGMPMRELRRLPLAEEFE